MLAAVIELIDRDGQILLARNAAWPGKFFGLITGFMEAGETPEDGHRPRGARGDLAGDESMSLIGVYSFLRMNQVIIAYHVARARRGRAVARADRLPRRSLPSASSCWPAGTGQAMADCLRARGIEPQWLELPPGKRATEVDVD